MQQLTKYEQETIINFNEDEKTASVYTYNKALIRKLQEYCKRFPNLYKLEKEDKHWGSKTFIVPKQYISVRVPKILTEEQKITAIDRAKKMREIRNLNIKSTG